MDPNKLKELKEIFYVSEKQEEYIFKKILYDLTRYSYSVSNPTAIILGGQPGSGKSELQNKAHRDLNSNAVICNVDDLKGYHPNSQEIKSKFPDYYRDIVNDLAHRWNIQLRNYCYDNKLNFIFETTLKDGKLINSTLIVTTGEVHQSYLINLSSG